MIHAVPTVDFSPLKGGRDDRDLLGGVALTILDIRYYPGH